MTSTSTSPYLDHIRSTREIITAVIVAREAALVKTSAAAQRRRVERELAFLHDELALIDAQEPSRQQAAIERELRDECAR